MLIFFNDILVYSIDWASHLQHLGTVIYTLQQNKLYTKYSKYIYVLFQIEYLGYIVSAQGVHMDPDKISAIITWSVLTTLNQLRGFLGISDYYRRFIKHYVNLAHPLTELLKKDNFGWSEQA